MQTDWKPRVQSGRGQERRDMEERIEWEISRIKGNMRELAGLLAIGVSAPVIENNIFLKNGLIMGSLFTLSYLTEQNYTMEQEKGEDGINLILRKQGAAVFVLAVIKGTVWELDEEQVKKAKEMMGTLCYR